MREIHMAILRERNTTESSAAAEILEFTCNHWERARNIGWIAYVRCDKDRPRGMNAGLKGKVITINSRPYICQGVEHNKAIGPIRKGERIGLRIDGEI
jgi:hypothetical protein